MHRSDRGLTSRIFKEFLQFNNRKTHNRTWLKKALHKRRYTNGQ